MYNDHDVQVIEPNFEEIQKWILQTVNDDMEDMIADLEGKIWKELPESAGYVRDPERDALVNRYGISRIRSIVKKYITRTSMLGNLTDYHYEQLMVSFVTVTVREVYDNKDVWEIPDGAEDSVVDTVVDFMSIILTRPRGGLDRGLFSNIKMQINRIVDEKDKKGGYVPTPLEGRYG